MEQSNTYDVVKKECCYNGRTIYGTAYMPQKANCKMTAVILSHGFNGVGEDMADIAAELAGHGIAAYDYDFCGGSTRSKSSERTIDMSITTEQEDLKAVIRMLRSMEEIDEKKIYLYGESQGGFISALTAADQPEEIAGLCLVFPAFCIPDDWADKKDAGVNGPFDFWGVELSQTFCDGLPDYDVFEHVSAYKGPVRIFHGDQDQTVNLSYSERLVTCFPDASLTVVPGAGHGFGAKDREMLKQELLKFIRDGK